VDLGDSLHFLCECDGVYNMENLGGGGNKQNKGTTKSGNRQHQTNRAAFSKRRTFLPENHQNRRLIYKFDAGQMPASVNVHQFIQVLKRNTFNIQYGMTKLVRVFVLDEAGLMR
jgi:hypothetical protein